MDTEFKIIFILRTFSLLLLSYAPSLYLFEILPSFILPLWSLIIIVLCLKIEKQNFTLSASVILISFSCILFWLITLFVCRIISAEFFDVLYLRLSIIIPFIVLQTVFVTSITVLFLKNKKARPYEPVIFFILFSLLFQLQSNYALSVFDHPVYALLFALLFFLSELTRTFIILEKRQLYFFMLFLPLLIIISLFIIKKYNDMSAANYGGLMQPTLFQFDFSDYLTLQSEIKMNDNLILIAHFNKEYSHSMLRRFYLSGWDPAKGFYEKAAPDEKLQPSVLPKGEKTIEHKQFELRENVPQEYFFVNLPASSFIAIDYPTKVIPYKIWDSIKFNGGYKVFSDAVYAFAEDVYSLEFPTGADEEGLSKADLRFYTSIDKTSLALVRDKAIELTQDTETYSDKIRAVLEYFVNGDFRYSLKPGKAPDGNQLKYFLTETKKGYCTYYAFSFTLMLRSLGIPARVAVGFFVQPESEVLNYYPVRSNMAHAWTEVFFPYIGWISFDPTTQLLAEGENLNFGGTAGGEEFNSLLAEILEKRENLSTLETEEQKKDESRPYYLKDFFHNNKNIIFILLCIGVLFLFTGYKTYPYLILKYSKNNRRIILTAGRLFKKKKNIKAEDGAKMTALIQKAKFSPQCTENDISAAITLLKAQSKNSKNHKE